MWKITFQFFFLYIFCPDRKVKLGSISSKKSFKRCLENVNETIIYNAYYLNNVTVSFFHYLLLGLPTLKRLSFEHNICVPSNLSLKVNVPLGAEKHWLLRTDGNNHSIRDRKRKRRKKRKKNQKCNFFLICLKVSFFEKSYQKSHEVVITFLLPLLKTRTWVLWHEIVQSHMKTAEMWIWRHERRWKSFPFKLLLTPFCYWMYCGRRGWKVGPPPSRWVPFLMKNWNPPPLALDKCEGYQPLNDFNEVAEP